MTNTAPRTSRPADRRDSRRPARTIRPNRRRMARLDYDGLAAYALELLEQGADEAAIAVYDEIHRRDMAEKRHARRMEAQRTRRAAARADYDAMVEAMFVKAEAETRGHMLSARGRAAGTTARDLFQGPAHVARKHASEEMLRWFAANGRVTFSTYCAMRSGRRVASCVSNGHDFI